MIGRNDTLFIIVVILTVIFTAVVSVQYCMTPSMPEDDSIVIERTFHLEIYGKDAGIR